MEPALNFDPATVTATLGLDGVAARERLDVRTDRPLSYTELCGEIFNFLGSSDIQKLEDMLSPFVGAHRVHPLSLAL